ncbi:uncharacterized protein MELLADRAFT_91834 [Melampsora larici-populina 98AG31]|uniref:Alpha-type protein kinase domain-containing protein n=1 Tax=Melampsora larici-populina (strain 98AG31 / pathotype 3-4-7) TaxID=747676 RepID=F4S0I2_MELLP|nr:uncharacterized protein MELLADRAFT_91834 [Melampsora larici-populina 98AG31]EGG01864.1 hypothetical protein MELLADRAFT_91834 [Melampsora larici-populina 98AG31]
MEDIDVQVDAPQMVSIWESPFLEFNHEGRPVIKIKGRTVENALEIDDLDVTDPEPPLSIGWKVARINPANNFEAKKPGNGYALVLMPNEDKNGVENYEFFQLKVNFRVNQNELIHLWDFRDRFKGQLILDKGTVMDVIARKSFPGFPVELEHYCRVAQAMLLATWLVNQFKDVTEALSMPSTQRKLMRGLRVVSHVLAYEDKPGSSSVHEHDIFMLEESLIGPCIHHQDDGNFRAIKNPTFQEENGVMRALTHWTYDHFKGQACLAGIHTIGMVITDIKFIERQYNDWAFGNLGHSGLKSFENGHKCSKLCDDLGLRKLPKDPSLIVN